MANNANIGGQNYDLSTYAGRQAARDNNPGVIVDASSAYNPGTGQQINASSGGGGGGSSGGGGGSQQQQSSDGGLQQLLNALASGNKAAADTAAAQFAQTFGLDTQKFQESVKEYNQNFGLAQAGISGQYNGAPTEAAREFDVTQANNAQNQSNQTALGVLNLASGLHADPFRQLNVMYGANGISGIRNAVNGLTGQYGLPGSFTAPAGGTSANLGGMMGEFANAASTNPQALAAATGLTNTNQIIARNYNTAPQNVKDFTTSALSMNTGLDQAAADKAIQNNLPKFTSPDFGLATV